MNFATHQNPTRHSREGAPIGTEAAQVVAERARVKRHVESGNPGQDAHTRALAGYRTMAHFRRKLVSL